MCDIAMIHTYTSIHACLHNVEQGKGNRTLWKHIYFSSSKTELQQRISNVDKSRNSA